MLTSRTEEGSGARAFMTPSCEPRAARDADQRSTCRSPATCDAVPDVGTVDIAGGGDARGRVLVLVERPTRDHRARLVVDDAQRHQGERQRPFTALPGAGGARPPPAAGSQWRPGPRFGYTAPVCSPSCMSTAALKHGSPPSGGTGRRPGRLPPHLQPHLLRHRSLNRGASRRAQSHPRRADASSASSCQYNTRKSARRRSSDNDKPSPDSVARLGRVPSRS